MAIRATNLLGARINGWFIFQELEDETILVLQFVDRSGTQHQLEIAVQNDDIIFDSESLD